MAGQNASVGGGVLNCQILQNQWDHAIVTSVFRFVLWDIGTATEVTGVEGGPTVHSQASSIFLSGHFQILLVTTNIVPHSSGPVWRKRDKFFWYLVQITRIPWEWHQAMMNSEGFCLLRILGTWLGCNADRKDAQSPPSKICLKSFGLWVWNELALLSRL